MLQQPAQPHDLRKGLPAKAPPSIDTEYMIVPPPFAQAKATPKNPPPGVLPEAEDAGRDEATAAAPPPPPVKSPGIELSVSKPPPPTASPVTAVSKQPPGGPISKRPPEVLQPPPPPPRKAAEAEIKSSELKSSSCPMSVSTHSADSAGLDTSYGASIPLREASDAGSDMGHSETLVGTVKSYNPAAGIGYITCSHTSDVWFGKQCLPEDLQWSEKLAGMFVSFRLEPSDDGRLRAEDDSVRPCDAQNTPATSSARCKKKTRAIPLASNEAPKESKKAQKRKAAKKQFDDDLLDFLSAPASSSAGVLMKDKAEAKTEKNKDEDAQEALQTVRRKTVLRSGNAVAKRKTKKRDKHVKGLDECEAEVEQETAAASPEVLKPSCKLCDQPIFDMVEDEEDSDDPGHFGIALEVCRKHLRELENLRRRLGKWAAEDFAADANELHALCSPNGREFQRGFCRDKLRVKLLVDYLLEKGADPEAEGWQDNTPLEDVVSEWKEQQKIVDKHQDGLLLSGKQMSQQKEEQESAEGLRNVALVLAMKWKQGQGTVSDDFIYKADCEKFAKEAQLDSQLQDD